MVKTMYIRVLVALFFIIGNFAFGAPARASVVWSSAQTHSDEVRIYTPGLPTNSWFNGTAMHPVVKLGVWDQPDFTTTTSTAAHIWARWNGGYINTLYVLLWASSGGDPFYGSGSITASVIPFDPDTFFYHRLAVYATSSLQEYIIPTRYGETIHRGDELWAFLYPSWSAYGANHWLGSDGVLPHFEICDGSCADDEQPPPDPCADGACASSVLFIPGMKGSVLKINDDAVWPPSFWSDDLPKLALTAEGGSVNPVVVDGVLETFYGTPIYSGFTAFMDELVAGGTTTEWKALPYDWRFSPERILADGIKTPAGTVDPIEEIETLAARSETGKVTIVAHSMGGLLGKAIIKKLQDEGKENLIDSFIMVGVPQLGTPQAATSLLHGGDEGIFGGLIVHAGIVREIAQNFQSAYDLLPSPRYFNEVAEPIITFDPNAVFTQEWRDYWGSAIDTYAEFFSFITGGGVERLDPEFTRLQIPEILRTDLAENARDFHNVYDTYAFPDSIRVVQVAGWGVPTAKAIKYKTRHFRQNYEPLFTREGDNTVVYPSAISSIADETYFFNIFDYNETPTPDVQHRSLLSATAIKDLILSVLKGDAVVETGFITETKPTISEVEDRLVISAHSPVILGAYDQNGRFSGISPNQDLGADVLLITENIPGSTFLSFGDSQYLFLPKEGSYSVVFQGVGTGPTDVEIENLANDTSTLAATYSDIPVSASTSATFMINSASPQDAHIQMDSNDDGRVDTYVAPDNQPLTLNELLTNLETAVQHIAASEKLKTDILKKMRSVEKKIAKQKNRKASRAVTNLEKRIGKKAAKDGLSDADVAEIIQLLEWMRSAL